MERHIFFGDVHGCIEELDLLLNKLELTSEDKLIFLGDLLDKGPASAEVVKRVRDLFPKHPGSVLIQGNHEEKHERFRKHLVNGGNRERTMKNYDELKAITDSLSSEDIAFLNTAVLFHHVPEHDIFAVHGGISPSISRLPTKEELAGMSRKKLKHYQQMLRVRYVDDRDYMIMLGEEMPGDKYWADVYDGRFGSVFFGHQPFMESEPKEFRHATGLDLGCVFGGMLCAIVVEKDKEYPVLIKAKNKYATHYGE